MAYFALWVHCLCTGAALELLLGSYGWQLVVLLIVLLIVLLVLLIVLLVVLLVVSTLPVPDRICVHPRYPGGHFLREDLRHVDTGIHKPDLLYVFLADYFLKVYRPLLDINLALSSSWLTASYHPQDWSIELLVCFHYCNVIF